MDAHDAEELRVALVRGCGLPATSSTEASPGGLLDELARRVGYLLRHDSEKLMYYLYALDVSEDVVASALEPSGNEEPERRIARAILEREAERLRTRKKYEQRGNGGKTQDLLE